MLTIPIKSKKDIKKIRDYFWNQEEYRNYTLFVLGINTALRISDLLSLKWKDVYDYEIHQFHTHINIIEKKTQKATCIVLNKSCIQALTKLQEQQNPLCGNEYIFMSRNDSYNHISRNRAYHIIKKAAADNHIEGNISCHSLRKTFGYHAWKEGYPPALIMHIYNHSSMEITKRYLSIEQDDQDELFTKMTL